MPNRKRIEDLRCPNIKGLPENVVHLLHRSLVEIVHLRGSIENTDQQVALSSKAVFESCELLKQIHAQGKSAEIEQRPSIGGSPRN
jgi:hypothetical protein